MTWTAALLLLLPAAAWSAPAGLTHLDAQAAQQALADDPEVSRPQPQSAGDGSDTSTLVADGVSYALEVANAGGPRIAARKDGKLLFRTRAVPYAGPSARITLSPLHRYVELELVRVGTFFYDTRTGWLAAKAGFHWSLSPDEKWLIDPPEVPFATEAFDRATVVRRSLDGTPPLRKVVGRLPLELHGSDELRDVLTAISPDGGLYAVLDSGHALYLFRSRDDARVGKESTRLAARALAFSRSGQLLVARGDAGTEVWRIDPATR